MNDTKENYYEILRLSETATVTEIVAAYHAAKQAYSSNSVAAYSLMDEEDSKNFMTELEQAFQVLSDPKRRKKYDKKLKNQNTGEEEMPTSTQAQESLQPVKPLAMPVESLDETAAPQMGISGEKLRSIRETRSMSVDDIARVTKIPSKFIKALEDENSKVLPARVYIQGFIKNLANVYKLDPTETAKAYLQSFDSRNKN